MTKNEYKAPFHYAGKASASERNKGCEGLYFRRGKGGGVLEPITQGEWEALRAEGKPTASQNPHPTVKPVAIMEWFIAKYSNRGDYILDPFGGSGTTGVAAMEEKRDIHVIEKDAESPGVYQSVIERRLWEKRRDIGKEANPLKSLEIIFEGHLSEKDPMDNIPDTLNLTDIFGGD